jgi:hypothetical protein
LFIFTNPFYRSVKPFRLAFLWFTWLLLFGSGFQTSALPLPAGERREDHSAAIVSASGEDVGQASLHHYQVVEAMAAPAPSLRPVSFSGSHFFLPHCYFFRPVQSVPATVFRFTQSYFRNIFSHFIAINAP